MKKYFELINNAPEYTPYHILKSDYPDILNRYEKLIEAGIPSLGVRTEGYYFEIDNQTLRKFKLALLYENKEFKEITDIIFNKEYVRFVNKNEIRWNSTSGISGSTGTSGVSGISGTAGLQGPAIKTPIGVSGSVGITGKVGKSITAI